MNITEKTIVAVMKNWKLVVHWLNCTFLLCFQMYSYEMWSKSNLPSCFDDPYERNIFQVFFTLTLTLNSAGTRRTEKILECTCVYWGRFRDNALQSNCFEKWIRILRSHSAKTYGIREILWNLLDSYVLVVSSG